MKDCATNKQRVVQSLWWIRMVEEAQKSRVNERTIVPGPANHLGQTKLDWTGLAGTSTSMVKPILFISSMGGSIILHKQTRCTVRL